MVTELTTKHGVARQCHPFQVTREKTSYEKQERATLMD
jgi:hypothetical protein